MLKAVMLITAIFVVLLAAGIVKAMALSILIPAVFSAIGYFTGSFIDFGELSPKGAGRSMQFFHLQGLPR